MLLDRCIEYAESGKEAFFHKVAVALSWIGAGMFGLIAIAAGITVFFAVLLWLMELHEKSL